MRCVQLTGDTDRSPKKIEELLIKFCEDQHQRAPPVWYKLRCGCRWLDVGGMWGNTSDHTCAKHLKRGRAANVPTEHL